MQIDQILNKHVLGVYLVGVVGVCVCVCVCMRVCVLVYVHLRVSVCGPCVYR